MQELLDTLKHTGALDSKNLEVAIRRRNRNILRNEDHFSKRMLMPYYLDIKTNDKKRWESWGITPEQERLLLRVLQIKPRRTASGVATVTVLTKPWPCSSNCLYCPNDLSMPKSYLRDEPACQRAERNYFDPYLQVTSRLRALSQMGHVTDKVELIVLGGTWSDYPATYQIWFMKELFRALNEADDCEASASRRVDFYRTCGLSNNEDGVDEPTRLMQEQVHCGALSYNEAWSQLYEQSETWQRLSAEQKASFAELEAEHVLNEQARHRAVGLVVETRPDTITPHSLTLLRRLGCTKIQIGIQSLDERILQLNNRSISLDTLRESFELMRLFGFKIHVHFMANLYGSNPQADCQDYLQLVTHRAYQPDEVKLYPCVLVEGTGLCGPFKQGTWQPYSEETLIDVLRANALCTPSFTRISRMIRDISAHDIVAGNKKVNLRQLVDLSIQKGGEVVNEIRYREISTTETTMAELKLEEIHYETTATNEYFLQWVTPEHTIAGFLRLSLPQPAFVEQHQTQLPIGKHEAMIREIHIYGKTAGLQRASEGAQHFGLGKHLVQAASILAHEQGYTKLNVISSVGTREYYRGLGFRDHGLYQQIELTAGS